jgi:hypothetical protein
MFVVSRPLLRQFLVLTALLFVTVTVAAGAPAGVEQDQDRFDPNENAAQAVSLSDGTYTGLRADDGDKDVYAVAVDQGDTLVASIRYPQSTGNLQLAVYNPTDDRVSLSNSDADNETVVLNARQRGTYRIVVSGHTGVTTPYAMTIRSGANVAAADLRRIEYGQRKSGQIDWTDPHRPVNRGSHEPVTFEGEAGDIVTITTRSDDDPYLILRGPGGQPLVRDDDSGPDANAAITNYQLPKTGTYTIVVATFGGRTVMDYSLALRHPETVPGDDDRFDPNNYPSNAAPIDAGSYSVEVGANASDYYAVDLSATERLDLSIVPERGSLNATVYDPARRVVDDGRQTDQATFANVVAETSGTYLVHVRGEPRGVTNYELRVNTTEFGESGAVPGPVSYGSTVTGTVDRRNPRLDDGRGYYESVSFDGAAGDRVVVNLTAGGHGAMQLRGPNGTVLARNAPSPGSSTSIRGFELPSSGTYAVAVHNETGKPGLNYSLTVQRATSAGTNDRHEPNNYVGNASPVEEGRYGGRIVDGERDVYAIRLPEATRLDARIDFAHDSGDLDLSIQTRAGRPVASSRSLSDGESASVVASGGRTYYVVVSGQRSTTAKYRLVLDQTPLSSSTDRFEPNDAPETATELSAETATDLRLAENDHDYFAVSLGRGERLIATADQVSTGTDPDLAVYGPNGRQRAVSVSPGGGEAITYAATTPGTYYLDVFGYRGGNATYDLTVLTQPAASNRDLRSISFGDERIGELDADDPTHQAYGQRHEPVTFTGRAGQRVTIETQSAEDTVLVLERPDGTVLARDTDGGDGLDARLEGVTLPVKGTYTIVVLSEWPDRQFTYDLSLQRTRPDRVDVRLATTPVATTPSSNATFTYELRNTGTTSHTFVLDTGLDTLPGEWPVVERSSGEGVWRQADSVLIRDLGPGETVRPSVTVQAPASQPVPESYAVDARAVANHRDASATIPVSVTRRSLVAAIDEDGDGELDDAEMLSAIERWQTGTPIEGTDGRSLSTRALQRLIEEWRARGGDR